jgi:5-methylcytosine-specific restriction protein B
MKTPLNRILYGPPGTGKTYHTINEALNIISPEFLNENKEDREVLNDKYRKLVEQGQIVFTTFHQSMTYEDFVEGIKPQEPNSPGDPISYIIEPGIFKRVCSKAMMKSENNFDTAYNAFLEEISNHADEKFKLNTKTGKVFAVSINSKNNLTLFTGSELKPNGTLTKENIQNQLINGESYDYWDSYFKGVINYLVERHNYVEKQTQSVKKYVLIIDEINRGNVSQIFGELITLLEDDKRLGEDESQRVKLPYSKEMFGVPSNLYLIGTMNTADRSVEALDSALRRRFSFVEMPPIPIILNTHSIVKDGIIDGFDLKILLSTINQRIEKILDKDHLIGHSYFLKVSSISELKFVFQQNIIPLLQEYFYGDYGKIGLVLGSGFVEKQEWENEGDLFADFDYDSSSLNDRPIYIIKDVQTMPDDDFKTSLNLLMNKE